MSTTSTHRRQKPRPIKPTMSLPSKVVEAVDKAMGDVGEADKVDLAALRGGVPQEEVDKVMAIEARYYSSEDYAKFTPTKKQKHFQLMCAAKAARNPGKTSNKSATVAELTTAVSAVSAAALAFSELTAATTKHAAAKCGGTTDSDAIAEPPWGRNCNNPAIAGHQEHVPKKPKT
jgi:hypothetical protein